MNLRSLFLNHVAQTSDAPMLIEVERAEGIYIYSPEGKRYVDLIAGVSVSNLGHNHPKIVRAVRQQVEKYMHLMVYGEYIQSPQVQFAKLLTSYLPKELSSVYFVNSGTEANEGAMKLAKRYTDRTEIVAFRHAYHGSTHGPLSIIGDESFRSNYRPLLPDVRSIRYNNFDDLNLITKRTACVVAEAIQGESGILQPKENFLQRLRKRCDEVGALLVFDEVQTGFGRTGSLFAFQKYNVQPDILTVAKAMGGGMPMGAFISSKEIMSTLTHNPVLGHITTFGGHPVSATAGLAALDALMEERLMDKVEEKENLFRKLLVHSKIKEVRGVGLILAVELGDKDLLQKFIRKGQENGILSDWFLFCSTAFRISPPLNITDKEIEEVSELILKTLNEI
ncbi:MAG: aspartate aminotransferase family protein [Prevotellaceae bacterium]|jgi:acetylornithine/succinyldiaminopimelate/putrescine aminotransferase|nr:aspartate aminotransferase family protein [Prevotellaceae bacterium]